MSMPNIPEGVLNITREQALNLIIASIAMEELGLSHIIEAEGEKLQYILGTLPGSPHCCTRSSKEILEVNKSIHRVLDSVLQNQMLLKGKLEQVLEAAEPYPCPPCPPPPVHHCPCQEFCGMQLCAANRCYLWQKDSFPWTPLFQRGSCICWRKNSPAVLNLYAGRSYGLRFLFSLSSLQPIVKKQETGVIHLWLSQHNNHSELASYRFTLKKGTKTPVTLLECITIPSSAPSGTVQIFFAIESKCPVIVERADLSVWTV